MNNSEWGYFVLVSRTGLTIRAGKRDEVFDWLSNVDRGIEDFDDAMEALNSDGWHHSFHSTEDDARALAREGIYCHGKWYSTPTPEVEDDDNSMPSP